MRRLRPLTEAECYARCYGGSGDESVRVIRLPPRAARRLSKISGEHVRRLFEERLEQRGAEVEAA
jgi:hypothetical protein